MSSSITWINIKCIQICGFHRVFCFFHMIICKIVLTMQQKITMMLSKLQKEMREYRISAKGRT